MKNRPLTIQIWLFYGAIAGLLLLAFTLLLPLTFSNFFTEEAYQSIESSQIYLLNNSPYAKLNSSDENKLKTPPIDIDDAKRHFTHINHLVLFKNGDIMSVAPISKELLQQIKLEAQAQQAPVQRYSKPVLTDKVLYVIRKTDFGFLISYIGETYPSNLVKRLFNQIIFIPLIIFLISLFPSIWLARYLARPLVNLEKHVKNIADRNWYTPIKLERKDEIGKLGQSIEHMRQRLVQQERAQQAYLQHISHELKTPVMVIRSYAQAIQDGIYPQGNLSSTIKIIDEEGKRLEKRIHNLLLLQKLEYLATHDKLVKDTLDIKTLIEEIVERLRAQRPELIWSLNLISVDVELDREQCTVALENILNNQLRYANNTIEIKLSLTKDSTQNSKVLLHVWNDGPSLEPEIMNSLFQKFVKGIKGDFGLGLNIVQRIIELHHGKIWAANENEGVAFYLEIPVKLNQIKD